MSDFPAPSSRADSHAYPPILSPLGALRRCETPSRWNQGGHTENRIFVRLGLRELVS